jgi:hypothetical protein
MSIHQTLFSRIAQIAAALLFAAGSLAARAATITNVTVANVTPSGFSLVWRGIAENSDAVQIYADANGQTNITQNLGVEFYPLHTGNPSFLEGYERRQSRVDLRAKTKSLGLVQAKVRNGAPGATYYYKIIEKSATATNTYPASGVATIQLPPENSFVVNSQQLIIDMPGVDHSGYIVTLTHAAGTYALAAVVGDGVGTNQVFFNLNDIFAMTGGNLSPNNGEQFDVTIMGPAHSDDQQVFNVAFADGFSVGGVNGSSSVNDFLIVNVGSGIYRTGETNELAIELNSSALLDFSMNIALPDGRFDKLILKPARAQIDPATISIVKGAGTNYTLSFRALAGSSISGQGPAVLLSFVPTNNTSAFIPVRPASILAHKADASPLSPLLAVSGRMTLVGNEPLVEATVDATGRKLTLYGKPWSSYEIQRSSAVGAGSQWQLVTRVPMTALSQSLPDLNTNDRTEFYRALEFIADPPLMELTATAPGVSNLRIFGAPGVTYNVQYTANISPVVQWNPLLTHTLSNSFANIAGLQTTNNIRFYRLSR